MKLGFIPPSDFPPQRCRQDRMWLRAWPRTEWPFEWGLHASMYLWSATCDDCGWVTDKMPSEKAKDLFDQHYREGI